MKFIGWTWYKTFVQQIKTTMMSTANQKRKRVAIGEARTAIAAAVRRNPGCISSNFFIPTGMSREDFEGAAGIPTNWRPCARRSIDIVTSEFFPQARGASRLWDFECTAGRAGYFYEDSLRATVAEDGDRVISVWINGVEGVL